MLAAEAASDRGALDQAPPIGSERTCVRTQARATEVPYRWRAASPDVPSIMPMADQLWPSIRALATASMRTLSESARDRKAWRTPISESADLVLSMSGTWSSN